MPPKDQSLGRDLVRPFFLYLFLHLGPRMIAASARFWVPLCVLWDPRTHPKCRLVCTRRLHNCSSLLGLPASFFKEGAPRSGEPRRALGFQWASGSGALSTLLPLHLHQGEARLGGHSCFMGKFRRGLSASYF